MGFFKDFCNSETSNCHLESLNHSFNAKCTAQSTLSNKIINKTSSCYVWVLRPEKIISLILSRVNGKWGETGDPREKPPDHPQAELGLSHMWPELGYK